MPKCEINLDASPIFKRLISKYQPKYPRLIDDFTDVFSRIEQDFRTAAHAAAVPKFSQTIWKYRCKCSDRREGASGGIRILAYYNASTNVLYPLTFYFKRDMENMPDKDIQQIIDEFKKAVDDIN